MTMTLLRHDLKLMSEITHLAFSLPQNRQALLPSLSDSEWQSLQARLLEYQQMLEVGIFDIYVVPRELPCKL